MELKIILGDTVLSVSDVNEDTAEALLSQATDNLRIDLSRLDITYGDELDYNCNRISINAHLMYDKALVKKTRLVCSSCGHTHSDPVRCYHITTDALFSIVCGCKAPLEYEEEALEDET